MSPRSSTSLTWPAGTRMIVRREHLHEGFRRSLFPSLCHRCWGPGSNGLGSPTSTPTTRGCNSFALQRISCAGSNTCAAPVTSPPLRRNGCVGTCGRHPRASCAAPDDQFHEALAVDIHRLQYLMWALGPRDDVVHHHFQETCATWTAVTSAGIVAVLAASGLVPRPPFTPSLLATSLTALVEGLATQARVDPEAVPLDLFGELVVAPFAGLSGTEPDAHNLCRDVTGCFR